MLKIYKFWQFNNGFNRVVFWILTCCSSLNGVLTHNWTTFWLLALFIAFITGLVAWWDDPKDIDSNVAQNRLGQKS